MTIHTHKGYHQKVHLVLCLEFRMTHEKKREVAPPPALARHWLGPPLLQASHGMPWVCGIVRTFVVGCLHHVSRLRLRAQPYYYKISFNFSLIHVHMQAHKRWQIPRTLYKLIPSSDDSALFFIWCAIKDRYRARVAILVWR